MEKHVFIEGEVRPLTARGISAEVCRKYDYLVGKVPNDYPAKVGSALYHMRGKNVHIEQYFEGNTLVGQKLRDRDKNFAIIGDCSNHLFGKHAVKPGGNVLVITEGAIDAMSYAEMRKGWPAVSIPNGGESARKTVMANLEFLESFEKVIFCFDNDEPGQIAVEKCKGLLSPKKMFIANLSRQYKDLNEALMARDPRAALEAVFQAEEVKPDGLVSIDDIMDEAMRPIEWGLPWFIPELTQMTYGRRWGEVYALGAGTGIGKTDVFTEQVNYDVNVLRQRVGLLFLEQKPVETAKRVAGKQANRRFHIPDDGWTTDELSEAITALKGMVMFYDSFGQTEWSEVKTRIRHMAVAEGIRIFYLDHLTAMADTSDEKGSLEQIMKEMAGLANELQIIIHFISHLSTPDGTPHEEGGRVMIKHFKGSRSIGFWSYFMFGLERDQQSEDEGRRHTTILRILKDRYTGQATGNVIVLGYDPKTGRIVPPAAQQFPEEISDDNPHDGF